MRSKYIKDAKKIISMVKKALKKNPNDIALQIVLKQEEEELKRLCEKK